MTGVRKRSRIARLRKSVKAISPTLAVLLMIAIAVIAAIVVYLWIMGFLNFNTNKAGKAIQIQSVMYTGTHLVVYVQNVGQGAVTFTPSQCLYVDGLLRNNANATPTKLEQTNTASIIDKITLSLNQKVKLKVVTNEGTWIEAYFTVYTFTGDYVLTIRIQGDGIGRVEMDPTGGVYYYDNVTLTAVPDAHSTFSGWSGDVVGNTNPAQIFMNGNKYVNATFTAIRHQITFGQAGIGSDFTGTVVTVDGVNYSASAMPSFSWSEASVHNFSFASPLSIGTDKQYVWTSTSGGLSNQQSDTQFTVPNGDGTITGNYGTQYYLTVSSPYGTPGGAGWYDASATAYATLNTDTVDQGNQTQRVFTTWSSDASGTAYAQSDPIAMDGAKTAVATWKTQYQVAFNVIPSGKGTTNPSVTGWFDEGAPGISINATATDLTYKFSYWSATGNITFADSASDSTTATVNGPDTITANFAINTVDITITSNPTSNLDSPFFVKIDDVNVTTPYTISWVIGSTHTLEALSPVSGTTGTQYAFTDWSDSGSQTHTCTVPNAPETVTANYKIQYSVTFDQTGLDSTASGTVVTINGAAKAYGDLPNTIWVDSGDTITYAYENIVSSSTAGIQFSLVTVAGPVSPITMTTPVTVTANYKTQYLVTFAQTGLDSDALAVLNVNSLPITYADLSYSIWVDSGSSVSYSYYATVQSSVQGKQFTLSSVTGPSSPISVSSPTTVSGNYMTQYNVTFEQTGLDSTANGAVVNVNGYWKLYGSLPYSTWVDSGDSVTYNCRSPVTSTNQGEQFNLSSVSGPASPFEVTGPITVTLNYVTQYNITFAQSGANSDFVSVVVTVDGTGYGVSDLPVFFWWDTDSSHSFAFQSPLVVTPDAKQYLWDGTSGLSTSQTGSITVSTPGTVTGNYVTQYYVSFAVSPPGSGSITTPSSASEWVYAGYPIVATPAAHYHFVQWTADTPQITFVDQASSSTTIASINAPGQVTANMAIDTFTLTVTVTPSGSGTVTINPSPGPYPYGTSVTLTAVPSGGMTFAGWSGDMTSTQNPLTVTMTSNLALTVTFAPPKLVFASGAGQTLAQRSMSAPITVQLQDALGNPLPATSIITINLANTGTTGTFYSDAVGLFSITTIQIASGGTTTAGFYYKDTAAGSRTLTASSTGVTSATTTFTIVATSYRLTFSQGAAQSLPANIVSAPIQLDAQVWILVWLDYSPSPAITVNLATSSLTGAFYSDAQGNNRITSITIGPSDSHSASFYYKDSSAGSPTLTASKSGYAPATATFSIYGAASKLVFIAGAGQTLATAATSAAVTVQRQDASGNPTTTGALIVNLATTSPGGNFLNGQGGAITSVTIADGSSSANFYYRDYNSGNPTLTASNGSLTPATTRFTITGNTKPLYHTSMTPTFVYAGYRTTYQYTITIEETFAGLGYARITVPAGFTGITVQSATATIFSLPILTWNYTVNGNVITIWSPDDLLSWLHFANDYVTVTFTATAPSSPGSYQFTSYTRQFNDGTGSGPGTNTGVDPSVTVGASAAFDHFNAIGVPSSATAGTAFSNNIVLTAIDVNGYVKTDYTGQVSFSSSDIQATLPGSYTFTAGDAGIHSFAGSSFVLKTAGTQTITATDTASGQHSTATISVSPGALHHFTMTGIPSSATVATPFSNPVVVTAYDTYGNVKTDFTGQVTFSSTDTQAAHPSAYTFTSGDSGVHSFAGSGFTMRTDGSWTITVSSGSVSLTSSPISVTGSAALDHFTFSNIGTQARDVPFTVTITAVDQYGNTVTSYTGTNTLSASGLGSGGSMTQPNPPNTGNFANGVWTGSITLHVTSTRSSVTISTSGSGKTGTSNTFRVT